MLAGTPAAVVETRCGLNPFLPSPAESAIEKHPACAAAINSSGLVPTPFSKRVPNEYWASARTPLAVEIVPLPSLRLPCQAAVAVRFIFHQMQKTAV